MRTSTQKNTQRILLHLQICTGQFFLSQNRKSTMCLLQLSKSVTGAVCGKFLISMLYLSFYTPAVSAKSSSTGGCFDIFGPYAERLFKNSIDCSKTKSLSLSITTRW